MSIYNNYLILKFYLYILTNYKNFCKSKLNLNKVLFPLVYFFKEWIRIRAINILVPNGVIYPIPILTNVSFNKWYWVFLYTAQKHPR